MLVLFEEVVVGNPEELCVAWLVLRIGPRRKRTYTIIAKLMAQLPHPLGRPLLGSIGPGSAPFFLAPGIPSLVS